MHTCFRWPCTRKWSFTIIYCAHWLYQPPSASSVSDPGVSCADHLACLASQEPTHSSRHYPVWGAVPGHSVGIGTATVADQSISSHLLKRAIVTCSCRIGEYLVDLSILLRRIEARSGGSRNHLLYHQAV
ncbi:hypothetical protein F4802DRAFT_286829 [Xylaria palmicola]|nr:hypothetical protein F4802DRAFT_286829 [Xylaria palmicola]